MRDKQQFFKAIIFAVAVMLMFTGCFNKKAETETTAETQAPSEKETQPTTEAVLKDGIYTAQDGSMSVKLPDDTWKVQKEESGSWVFASPGKGEITIVYTTGEGVENIPIGSTEERLLKTLKKADIDANTVELSDFKFDKTGELKICTYTLKAKDTTSGTFFTVAKVVAEGDKGFQVSAAVQSDDPALLTAIQEAVKSFQPLGGQFTKVEEGTETGSESTSAEEERYFFSEAGDTIYTHKNADGDWADKNGMVYEFYEKGVLDANGVKYYYDPPSHRGEGSTDSSNSSDPADYADFYTKDGKYIKARQNADGKWVDENGISYVFGDKGVTDSNGVFHPY